MSDGLPPALAALLTCGGVQLGGFAFIGEGIPVGLGAAYRVKYMRVRRLLTMLKSHSMSCGSPWLLSLDMTAGMAWGPAY